VSGGVVAELVEILAEHLDVARLVDDLAGEAELGLHLRHLVQQLSAEGECRLLAEEKLAK